MTYLRFVSFRNPAVKFQYGFVSMLSVLVWTWYSLIQFRCTDEMGRCFDPPEFHSSINYSSNAFYVCVVGYPLSEILSFPCDYEYGHRQAIPVAGT